METPGGPHGSTPAIVNITNYFPIGLASTCPDLDIPAAAIETGCLRSNVSIASALEQLRYKVYMYMYQYTLCMGPVHRHTGAGLNYWLVTR